MSARVAAQRPGDLSAEAPSMDASRCSQVQFSGCPPASKGSKQTRRMIERANLVRLVLRLLILLRRLCIAIAIARRY